MSDTTELKIALRHRSRRRVVVIIHGTAIIKEYPVQATESDYEGYMRVMALVMDRPEFQGVTRTSTEAGGVLTEADLASAL